MLTAIGVVVVLILITSKGFRNHGDSSALQLEKYKQIAGQAKHWLYAARQDKHPLVGLVHASIAASKIQSLILLCPSKQLEKVLQIDIVNLQKTASELQQSKLAQIKIACPTLELQNTDDVSVDWFI